MGLSQGAAASALGGAAPATPFATAGLSQGAAAEALAPTASKSFMSQGFKNQLTSGLISNAPSIADMFQKGPAPAKAPAGNLQQGPFNPAQNLFLQFERRRR